MRLDAFRVTEADTRGYRADATTSGTLVRTPVRELPVSIQVVTEQFIADMDARRVEDAVGYISGVSLTNRNEGRGGSSRSESFVIRGFETNQVLRNGVRLQGITNSANLERIEVLKGPTSIFFGASDPGGLVNYITKQPRKGQFGTIKAGVGRWDYRYAELDVNTPLIGEDRLLFRITGSLLDSDGWRSFWKDEQTFVNPVITWNATSTTRLTYDYQYRRQTGIQERMGDVFLSTDNPAPHTQRLLTGEALRRSIEINALTPTDTYWEEADNHVVTLVQSLGEDTVVQAIASTGDSNRLQRTTITRNRVLLDDNLSYIDRPGLLEEGGVARTINLNVTHAFEMLGTQNNLVVGWDRSEIGNKNIFIGDFRPEGTIKRHLLEDYSQEELYRVIRYPQPSDGGQSGFVYIANQPFEKPVWNQGVYATNQTTLMDERLHLFYGARWTSLRALDQTKTTPQGGVNFALTPEASLYALYSESFRPNGRSDTRDPASAYLAPEGGEGIELGTKFGLWKNKLSGTFALFQVTKTNIRRVDAGAVVEGRNGVTLSDGEESKGFELDLLYTPTRNLTLVFAYARTDARVTDDVINPPASPDLDGDGRADTIGLKLKGVAPKSASIWTKYEFTDGLFDGLGLGAGVQWRDGPIAHDASFQRKLVVEDGYTRVDLLVNYRARVFGKLTRFQLNLDNVTDEFYSDKSLGYANPFNWRFSVALDF